MFFYYVPDIIPEINDNLIKLSNGSLTNKN
jgi:hypothetical protein